MLANERAPQSSAFKQQRLPAWQPILTPRIIVLIFLVIGVIFLPLGGVILSAANSVKEVKVRYDNDIDCQISRANSIGKTCQVSLTVPEDMEGPVYFYYELHNFYQNHRRYVKSRSDTQLRNSDMATAGCSPLEDFNDKKVYPCGLIAGSYFNDLFAAAVTPAAGGPTVSLSSSAKFPFDGSANDTTLIDGIIAGTDSIVNEDSWRKKGIAWSTDVEHKFKQRELQADETNQGPFQVETNTTLPVANDEDLIVWMRTAGLPDFRKLHRIVDRDFKKDDKVTVTIKNNFPVDEFDGEKWVVLSTMSWMGGKNTFLGSAYIFVGVLCLVAAAAFGLAHKYRPRNLGDLSSFDDM